MHRKKAVSVVVKAPSRGLVTRWPSETADRFNSSTPDLTTLYTGMALQRASTAAKNVRFEDGVVAAAPGYNRIKLVTPILANCLSFFPLGEVQPGGSATGSGSYPPINFDAFGTNNLFYAPENEDAYYPNSYWTTFYPQQVSGLLGNAVRFVQHTAADGARVYLRDGGALPVDRTQLQPYSPLQDLVNGDFTVVFWFRPSVDSTVVPALSNTWPIMGWPGFQVAWSNNQLAFASTSPDPRWWTNYLLGPANLAANAWYFVVVTFTKATNTLGLWINGTQVVGPQTAVNGGAIGKNPTNTYGNFEFYLGDGLYWDVYNTYDVEALAVWNRVISGSEVAFLYNSGNGVQFPYLNGQVRLVYESNLLTNTFGDVERPLFIGTDESLYSVAKSNDGNGGLLATLTSQFTGASIPGRIWRAADFYNKTVFAQSSNQPQYWDGAQIQILPGLPMNQNQYSGTADGSAQFDGVESFFGHLLLWRDDVLTWSDLNDCTNYIPIGQTAAAAVLTVASYIGGVSTPFNQPAVGGTVVVPTVENAADLGMVTLQYVRCIDPANPALVNYYSVASMTAKGTAAGSCSITLQLLGTTGRSAQGTTFPAGAQILTLNANEAGQAHIVGAMANGQIYQVVAAGDYAYLFKEWSIGTLQYVGQSSGTFFYRTEVTREGMIGHNAWTNLGNGTVVFLGHREMYTYQGGPTPTPVARQYTRQVFAELDRTRLDEIVMMHRLHRNEVWLTYPVVGGFKLMIWNYAEDTVTLDEYDPGLSGLLAMSVVNWEADPAWQDMASDLPWAQMDNADNWAAVLGQGMKELAVVGTGNGLLLNHGTCYSRDGLAYTALVETMDYDFGDPSIWKYVDVVLVGLQVQSPDNAPRTLYVQVGARSSLDADITWSNPQPLQTQGDANTTAKVNPGGAGRYIRLRFYSQDPEVRWRVSSFEIYARPGGTY